MRLPEEVFMPEAKGTPRAEEELTREERRRRRAKKKRAHKSRTAQQACCNLLLVSLLCHSCKHLKFLAVGLADGTRLFDCTHNV